MSVADDMISIHVNIDIKTSALEAIVENAKKTAGKDQKGYYRVDTADKVSEMVSRFLSEKNFEAYVKDAGNYSR